MSGRTENRMSRTVFSEALDHDSVGADGQAAGAEAPALVPWKPGHELPPFTSSNPAVFQLLQNILSGTAGELPSIVVSEAVSIQIYMLVVEQKALSECSMGAVYVVLASLARWGSLPPMPTQSNGSRAR